MVHRILAWCRGYVRVRLPGGQAERFINVCRSRGIYWWGISWDRKQNAVYGCLSRADYYRLRPVAEKTGAFPVVVERCGGYFWLRRGMDRASFWCGIGVFLFLMWFLSGRIWGIEVQGQSYHTVESVLRYLETEDVYGGMPGRGISCAQIEAKLRGHYPDVGWVSVEKSGSKLYVRMDEVVLAAGEEKETPASLVAEQKGRVLSIVTRKGTARVRAGDKVKKGQTLISGKVKIIGDNDEVVGKKRVQAQGTVVLRCGLQYRDTLGKSYQSREYSGRSRTLYQLQLGKRNLFFYNPLKSLETYEKYDIIREGGRLCPFLSLRFPVSAWRQTFREIDGGKAQYPKREAEELLQARYAYYLQQLEEKGCYDISGELSVQEQGGSFTGTADIRYSKQQAEYH